MSSSLVEPGATQEAQPDGPPLTLRVLDISRGVAGAYAGRLLADLGASCSRLRWQPARHGDWPSSPAFR
ncbi:MAG TPA: hypothetical protein VH916_02895, partial [Dehalococcoidia bacterium]